MGTASFGTHGSGSGMRSGGGDAGGAISLGGQMSSKPFNQEIIREEVRAQFKELFARATPYLRSMFYNTYLTNIFEELFAFSALLHGEQPALKIGERYDISMDEPLFIINLISKLDQMFRAGGVDPRPSEAARLTLEKILFSAVRDDPYLSIDGSGNEVVEAMRLNTAYWKNLSGQMLANLAVNIYKKDVETKTPTAANITALEIEQRTNQVIKGFEETYGNQKAEYRKLFDYIDQHWDWFKEEMIK